MADFDLFSDNASLPEASFEFGENTIDAIRLNFDLVEDEEDGTLSDSLFSNDVTIDADSVDLSESTPVEFDATGAQSATASPGDDQDSESSVDESLSRAAHAGFVLEDNVVPNTIEFDFRNSAVATPVTLNHPPARQEQQGLGLDAAVANIAGSNVAGSDADSVDNEIGSQRVGVSENPGTASHVADDVADTGSDIETSHSISTTPHASAEAAAFQDAPAAAGNASVESVSSPPLAAKRSVLPRRIWQCFLLLLTLAIVAALYGYRQRDNLADNTITRPFYTLWCSFQGCEVPARFDKSKLKVVEKNIISHPTLTDALVITVLLENRADFEQRYPVLFLWLSDSTRRTVASNEFDPSVYLPENDMAVGSILAPGQRQQISIDVRDPGRRAVSLELSLR